MKCVYCVNTFLAETFSHLETNQTHIWKCLCLKLKYTAVFYYKICGTERIYTSYTYLFIQYFISFLSCKPVVFGEMHNYSEVIFIRVLNVNNVHHAISGFICA